MPRKKTGISMEEQMARHETILLGHDPRIQHRSKFKPPFEWRIIGENKDAILLLSKEIVAYKAF